ncbi:hypothetical protein HKX48_007714 [Thoreauomyces humboldtii]|nr:hypothetical protein HKX48_007714 [Thoreauomyces humboldtii]
MVFGFFEGKQWDASEMPSRAGMVAIVTGGNTGIGYESVLHLALKDCRVYMAARSEEKAAVAIQKIKDQKADAQVEWLKMDLLDLASVKAAAEAFLAKEKRCDILINNAGIMGWPYELSKDGVESQFQTNHLGHFLFTRMLLPTLIATSKLPGTSVRIVNVSSLAHKQTRSIMTFDTLENVNQTFGSTWLRYGQSKLANILFTNALDRKLAGEKIFANSIHPGVINSELGRGPAASYGKIFASVYDVMSKALMTTVYQGSLNQLYCATSPEIEEKGYRGKYFTPVGKLTELGSQASNETLADNLWNLSEKVLAEKGFL